MTHVTLVNNVTHVANVSSRWRAALAQVDRKAWIRFFVALAGLALAFVSALLSTAFRESGNLIGTAVSASAALLVAGGVAIYTVPFLARRVSLEKWGPTFHYDVTKEGAAYLGLTLIIGIAAFNTGNNLLFMVVAAMLSAIMISGIVSAAILRGLTLEVGLPAEAFAGLTLLARLTLRNHRRVMPAFSVSIVPEKIKTHFAGRKWQRVTVGFPWKRPPHRQWFRLPDLQWRPVPQVPAPGAIFESAAYFPYIPSRSSSSIDLELTFPRRGRFVQGALGVSTRFPFSFLVKTRLVKLAREIIVYPSVQPTDEFFEVLPLITGEQESHLRGHGYELYRIRDYLPEDTARHVDWKATAKSGALKVREFSREDERRLRIVFDNPAPGVGNAQKYEEAVALAASLAWHFAGEATDLSFAAQGCEDGAAIYEFLRYLATVQPDTQPSIIDSLPMTEPYNLVFTSRAQGSIPTALWTSSYFIFI